MKAKVEIASMDYSFEKFDYNKEKRDSVLVAGGFHSRENFKNCLFLRGRDFNPPHLKSDGKHPVEGGRVWIYKRKMA